MPKEIRFCVPSGPYWFLSPLAPFPIKMTVDGQSFVFPSTEHYYQAMKFYASDPRFNVILNTPDADATRLLTKTPEYKLNRRENFDNEKFDIMERGLRAKFAQNADAAKMLRATGDAILIKACPVCYKCGFGIGSGANRIGKIMMDIRKTL
jgi:ribA/ribD-fused uncharacterized protein